MEQQPVSLSSLYQQGITRRTGKLTREEALTVCPRCGVVEPHYVRLTSRWLRRPCPCEEEQREQAERKKMLLAWEREQVYRTYDWLRLPWNDLDLVEKTLENFRPIREVYDESQARMVVINLTDAYEAVRDFCLNPEGTLVLHGSYGVGKTHLLAAICNELRKMRVASRFTTATNLHRRIHECYQLDEDPTFLYRNAINTPLLALDDIGAGNWTRSRQETLETILDERTKTHRPTAISTNSLDEMAKFAGGRVYSRLSIGQIPVEMTGPDYRKEL